MKLGVTGRAIGAASLSLAIAAGAFPAVGQDARPESWPDVKCARYRKATADALARLTTRGLGRDFLDGHEAFLASNCMDRAGVCPRTEEELRLANVLVMAGMNAGMASTFFPFSCRR